LSSRSFITGVILIILFFPHRTIKPAFAAPYHF